MTTEKIEALCKELAFAGKDYTFIKAEIDAMDLSDAQKVQAMVKADEFLVHYQVALQERQKAVQLIILGLIVTAIGVGAGIYVATVLLKKYYLFYGIAFIGCWIFGEGYQAYQVSLEDIESPLDKVSGRRKK